jgi:hypothetical protein
MTHHEINLADLNLDEKIIKIIGLQRFQRLDRFFGGLPSSYAEARYWRLFYVISHCHNWKKISELGVLAGYSLIALAAGSQKAVDGYDLFDDYQYNQSKIRATEKNCKSFPELVQINLIKRNILDDSFENGVFLPDGTDLLSVDLSNCADIYRRVISGFKLKGTKKCIVFEGGSKSRDQVKWMLDFKREPINNFLKNDPIQQGLNSLTILDYPSLTIVSDQLFNPLAYER